MIKSREYVYCVCRDNADGTSSVLTNTCNWVIATNDAVTAKTKPQLWIKLEQLPQGVLKDAYLSRAYIRGPKGGRHNL